jgi:hypothetical protein
VEACFACKAHSKKKFHSQCIHFTFLVKKKRQSLNMKQKLFSPFQQQKVLMEEVDLVAEAHLSTRNATKPLTKSHDLYLRKLRVSNSC